MLAIMRHRAIIIAAEVAIIVAVAIAVDITIAVAVAVLVVEGGAIVARHRVNAGAGMLGLENVEPSRLLALVVVAALVVA